MLMHNWNVHHTLMDSSLEPAVQPRWNMFSIETLKYFTFFFFIIYSLVCDLYVPQCFWLYNEKRV